MGEEAGRRACAPGEAGLIGSHPRGVCHCAPNYRVRQREEASEVLITRYDGDREGISSNHPSDGIVQRIAAAPFSSPWLLVRSDGRGISSRARGKPVTMSGDHLAS